MNEHNCTEPMEETTDCCCNQENGCCVTPEPPLLEQYQKLEKEHLLLLAEFENYRKRLQKTTDQKLKYAIQPLILNLLNVYDNLAAMKQQLTDEKLIAGVELITQSFLSALKEQGIQKIDGIGKFNPELHEVIDVINSTEEPNTILEVIFDGFILHDRVIRAAKVKIASNESPS